MGGAIFPSASRTVPLPHPLFFLSPKGRRLPKRMVACLTLCLAGAARAEDKKPVPTFTNDDLERVSPFRDQTGALSAPAVQPKPAAAPPASRGVRDETYWRREAERHGGRMRLLRRSAAELRLKIDEAWRAPEGHGGRKGRSGSAPASSLDALRRRLQAAEEEIRDEDLRFEERARRAGALPGWLR